MASTTQVRICCGDAVGTLSLTSGRVSCQGQDVSTTEFERIGGRGSSKKWKQSVRVINGDGTSGKLIGDWLTDRGLDIKNNKVIQVNNTSSALKHPSSVPKPVTRPQIPVDVRRELATPINSEMHSVFSGSKPMDKGQKSPTVQPCTQSQDTLQHQQPSLDDSRSAQPAAMLSLPPFQQQSMEGPAAQKSSQAQGVISGSESAVAAEPQPIQLHLPGIYAHSGALLQASAEGVPSRPPRCLPAPDIAGTLPQRSTELPAQQSQLMSEHTVPAAPTVSTDQMQARSEPAGPPADAIIVQACSASMPAQNPTPTAELAASAAGSCPLQGQRQVSTGLPQADTDPATQQASKQALPKRALMHVPQAQPAEVLKTDLLKHMQVLYPGLLPGDSTAEVPKELPKVSGGSSSSTRTLIDITAIAEEDLIAMSRESAEAPLGEMLPVPPGILPGREAHMTGHRPLKRQRKTIVPLSPDEAAAQIGQYMAGELKHEPWHAFGLGKAPIVGGKDLNLKLFYKVVQSYGGFASCVANKSFAKITTKLGIDKSVMTNASFLLRNHYTKFLLAYEQQMEILASADGAGKRSVQAVSDASSGPTGTTDASELPAGNESCAGEDAEVRSISAVPSWQSSRDLPGKVVALVQDSEQDSGGMLPLQDKTAVALEPGPVSWEGKSILGAEGGVGIPSSSNQLLADACVEIDPTNVLISNRAAPIEESGLEDPMA